MKPGKAIPVKSRPAARRSTQGAPGLRSPGTGTPRRRGADGALASLRRRPGAAAGPGPSVLGRRGGGGLGLGPAVCVRSVCYTALLTLATLGVYWGADAYLAAAEAARPAIGGQAVIEGVMMRSPHSFAVAVRRPDGSIVVREEPWLSFSEA